MKVDGERPLDAWCSVLVTVYAECKNPEGHQDSVKTTYTDVLVGFENVDIVGVVAVVHLPQDGNHACNKTPLQEKKTQAPNPLDQLTNKIWAHVLGFPRQSPKQGLSKLETFQGFPGDALCCFCPNRPLQRWGEERGGLPTSCEQRRFVQPVGQGPLPSRSQLEY